MADARQALEELLDALGEASQFATSGSRTPVLPGLLWNQSASSADPATVQEYSEHLVHRVYSRNPLSVMGLSARPFRAEAWLDSLPFRELACWAGPTRSRAGA